MEYLTIKSYGVKFTIPCEILLLENCSYVGATNDHLVLGKTRNSIDENCFVILRKNGIVINSSILLYPANLINANYQACTVERYFKMRSFL